MHYFYIVEALLQMNYYQMEPAALEQMLQHTNQLSELTFNLRISDFIPYNQIVYYTVLKIHKKRTDHKNRESCVWKFRFNKCMLLIKELIRLTFKQLENFHLNDGKQPKCVCVCVLFDEMVKAIFTKYH